MARQASRKGKFNPQKGVHLTRLNKTIDVEKAIQLNSLGFSHFGIAKELKCHPSSVTRHLNSMGISSSDTRHSFMERFYRGLSEPQQKWLITKLGPHYTLDQYLKDLVLGQFLQEVKLIETRGNAGPKRPKGTKRPTDVQSNQDEERTIHD